MSGIVVNNRVKMEWQKSGWLQTSKKNGKGAFIFASQDYESSKPEYGIVTVYFTAETAFLVVSDEGTEDESLWSAEDFIPVIKKERGGNFPYDMVEYVPIIVSGDNDCIVSKLETYGLEKHKDDIEARLRDLVSYGYEEEFDPTAQG